MDAQPATYTDVEQRLQATRDKYARGEGYFDASERTSPWVPMMPHVWLRHLTFDTHNNLSVHIMRVDQGGSLGKHRHHSFATGYVLSGSLRYEEYDWVAKAGEFFHESPGRTHTLVSDNGMETLFHLGFPVDFFDAEGRLVQTVDIFWMIENYETWCTQHGIPINRAMYI